LSGLVLGTVLLLMIGVVALCCCTDTGPAPAGTGSAVAVQAVALDASCDVHAGSTDASPAPLARPSLPAPPSIDAARSTGAALLAATPAGSRPFDHPAPGRSPHQLCVMRT